MTLMCIAITANHHTDNCRNLVLYLAIKSLLLTVMIMMVIIVIFSTIIFKYNKQTLTGKFVPRSWVLSVEETIITLTRVRLIVI
jgi:hypothetical protein